MSRPRDNVLRGTRALQPAVTEVAIGALYCVTDEDYLVERSNGLVWEIFSVSGDSVPSTAFAFGDATPAAIGTFTGAVLRVSLLITEAFDGTGASLQIGTVGTPNLLMDSSENDPTEIGRYEANPAIELSSDSIVLTIVPGSGASTGAGYVYLEIV